MASNDVIVPTVHLNGTSSESLMAQLQKIDAALDATLSAMAEATPHNRDYYVQADPDAGYHARLAHGERMMRLEAVRAEIQAIWQGIYDQTIALEAR
jgi:hypothetical protein